MNRPRRAPALLLTSLFAGSVVFSLAGMLALKLAPQVAAAAGPWLPHLMRWPTWVYVVTLPLAVLATFLPALGWRRSLAVLVWGAGVGAAAELIGTATGFPFGAYAYTDFLGARIAGRVPWAIPPSWYAASLLSFAFATSLGLTGARRIVLAAAYLTLWDVALDPAMSAGFPVWVWHQPGLFYGMPLINWAGWFGTGLVIMAGCDALLRHAAPRANGWAVAIWLTNGLFAVGICALAGLHAATVLGAVAVAVPVALRRPAARWLPPRGAPATALPG